MTEKTKHYLKTTVVGCAVGAVTSLNSLVGYGAMVKLYDKLDFKYQKKMKRYKELQVKFSEGTLTTDESNELSDLQLELNDISEKNTRQSILEDQARNAVGIVNTVAGVFTGAWALNEDIKYRQSQKKEKPAAKPKTTSGSKGKGTKK